jgi:hypothetical protein
MKVHISTDAEKSSATGPMLDTGRYWRPPGQVWPPPSTRRSSVAARQPVEVTRMVRVPSSALSGSSASERLPEQPFRVSQAAIDASTPTNTPSPSPVHTSPTSPSQVQQGSSVPWIWSTGVAWVGLQPGWPNAWFAPPTATMAA